MLPQIKEIEYWRLLLRQNFNRVDSLVEFLELTPDQKTKVLMRPKFPIQVPLRLAKKMAKETLDDPLVRQFVPLIQETEDVDQFVSDPVCDRSFQKTDKLLHKYQGRVLLVCTSACAMHCRYCFRQNFDYDSSKCFDKELAWIANDLSIEEVILSGGDPLSLSDPILKEILDKLGAMPHIRRIRFHTRFPIGIPERINPSFLSLLKTLKQEIYFILHVNHPRELDEEVIDHLKLLKKIGCTLLNQTVLLKGINDNALTLIELSKALVNAGILPYYLHQLDRVKGAAHFEVEESKGHELISLISKELPGYAVPRYVKEIAGQEHKTIL